MLRLAAGSPACAAAGAQQPRMRGQALTVTAQASLYGPLQVRGVKVKVTDGCSHSTVPLRKISQVPPLISRE